MSWWTNIRDSVEKAATLGLYDPKASRQGESDQRQLIASQVKAYRDQTELTRQELANKSSEENYERRRVQEKQIRSLRQNYRPGGSLLGMGAAPTGDTTNSLGG